MRRCEKCRGLIWGREEHVCPPQPQWEVWDEEHLGDEYRIVFGVDAEDAGVIYAEEYDSDECDLLSVGEITVKIRPLGEIEWETYKLRAETTIDYTARVDEGEVSE